MTGVQTCALPICFYAAPQSYRDAGGEEYLLNFGLPNIHKFYAKAEQSSTSPMLKHFVFKTGVELQLGLESALARDPKLATSRGDLLKVAYGTHVDAYLRGGFTDLRAWDRIQVAFVPSAKHAANPEAMRVYVKFIPLVIAVDTANWMRDNFWQLQPTGLGF